MCDACMDRGFSRRAVLLASAALAAASFVVLKLNLGPNASQHSFQGQSRHFEAQEETQGSRLGPN